MPIVNVPVIQRFGIISTKYHHELQKQLLEKAEEIQKRKSSGHRRPLQVTEEFIKQFNDAELDDEQCMLDSARRILLRNKRRLGPQVKDSGNPLNLHLAWTELLLMTQCKGKIQEEALDILLISLDEAELDQNHIPLLFYMAESVLHRICCDTAQNTFLSTNVKLSKLGFVTFLRLYCFHLIGKLQHFEEQKEKLKSYLKALSECEATYRLFPSIRLSVHTMLKVGESICVSKHYMKEDALLQKEQDAADSLNSGASELDPFLWHCLLIWQHVQNNSTHYQGVIKHLLLLKEHLHQDNWLDSLLALLILGQAAKKENSCLKALMQLGSAIMSYIQEQFSIHMLSTFSPWPWQVICIYTSVLADICLHGTTSDIQKHAFIGFQRESIVIEGSNEASLNGLLHFNPSDSKDQLSQIISYCTVYNLVKICHELQEDLSRDGMRNAIHKALDQRKRVQRDTHVLDAEKVAEVELNAPSNPFNSAIASSSSSSRSLAFFQHVGCRLAKALSQQFLPPVMPYIPTPRRSVQRHTPSKTAAVKDHIMEKKAPHLPSRQEQLHVEPPLPTRLHFFTRNDLALKNVMEDQWTKELTIRMKEEKENMDKEKHEKQKKEEEHFNEVMKKREQKLKKTSKPYELP